jgi:hypothetical protein
MINKAGLSVLVFMMLMQGFTHAQSLSQIRIDEAMNVPIVHNASGPDINTELWTDKIVGKDKALYFLALNAYLNPKIKSTDGRLVRVRVMEHLRNIIAEDSTAKSREPSCRGDLAGWKDIGQVLSLLLAKKTPEIWLHFNAQEIEKFDWLMRAFAVSGNYHSNFLNWPKLCMYQTYRIGKTWNPNHNDGYIGVMIAAYYYFGGADTVNKILTDFKYDTYISKFRQLHFHNIEETWTAAGTKTYPEGKSETFMKNLLENPSDTVQYDKANGEVFGARMPFIFGAPPKAIEKIAYDPVELYRAIGSWMYPHIVTDRSRSGTAYTLNNGSSPMAGKHGMCREFQVTDGFEPNVKERSDARYAWWGWMMHIPIVATMMAIHEWPGNGKLSDTENRMYVGSEDLLYKLKMGYHSYSLGTGKEHFDYQFEDQGYLFITDIWNNYIKKQMIKADKY